MRSDPLGLMSELLKSLVHLLQDIDLPGGHYDPVNRIYATRSAMLPLLGMLALTVIIQTPQLHTLGSNNHSIVCI